MVCDAHLAEDVTQVAFVALAQNARDLTHRPVLSGWLHRTARNLATKVVRTEARRRAREREAAAMNELLSAEADTTWKHIAPQLDAALGELSEPDRDALLLRYFERKSASEMAQTLGISDEAAQKRVNRAVERLREFFAKRGVTVGASGLAIVISANAVQAAPVGLAVTISNAAALAGTTVAATTTATASKTIAMTTIKIKLAAAVVIAALAIPLAVLWYQNASLRQALASRRASAPEAQRPLETNSPPGQLLITNDELRRLRMEHLELLRLRGRVTQLANELRQRKAARTPPDTSPNPASEPKDSDSILFSASLTNRVAGGQTLLVGGWSMNGIRRYLLITPAIQNGDDIPDGKPLAVQSQMVTAPESFWDQIGWDSVKSDSRRSTLAGVLTPEQLDSLLKALKETKDADISNSSLAKRRNGEDFKIGFAIEDEQGTGTLMVIDVNPWIAADGRSVDLEIRPGAASANAPIHHSLQPAGQPASPSAP
jgi:RNA polymerase sigma factor (sigma-70 family)